MSVLRVSLYLSCLSYIQSTILTIPKTSFALIPLLYEVLGHDSSTMSSPTTSGPMVHRNPQPVPVPNHPLPNQTHPTIQPHSRARRKPAPRAAAISTAHSHNHTATTLSPKRTKLADRHPYLGTNLYLPPSPAGQVAKTAQERRREPSEEETSRSVE